MIRRRARSSRSEGQEFQSINITPFTDVLLVLLIIFLIAGSSLTRSAVGIESLGTRASAVNSEVAAPSTVRGLRVDIEGRLWLWSDGRMTQAVELATLDPEAEWELSAEPSARMQFVVDVYDRMLKAGFTKLTLVEP